MLHAVADPVLVCDQFKSNQLGGCPIVVDVHDPDGVLGPIATICFTRRERNPAKLLRDVLINERGRGRFYGWAPAGLREISLLLKKEIQPPLSLPSLTIRQAYLIEVAARATLKSPWAMLQTARLLFTKNWRGFRYRFGRLYDDLNEPAYETWLKLDHPNSIAPSARCEFTPPPPVLISIVGEAALAGATRRSLAKQSYKNIREVPINAVAGTSAHSARPCFWMRIAAGSQLHNHAIERLIQPLLAEHDVAAAYCDEDRIDAKGRRFAPFFHPAWNPPLAETGWLAPTGTVLRLNGGESVTDLEDLPISQLLVATAKTGRIVHVPMVLAHRFFPRAHVGASVPKIPSSKTNVSVIIPTRDRADLLRVCLTGLFEGTRYDDLEVIIIDNDSQEPETHTLLSEYEERGAINRIIQKGSFNFASACNLGVASARHDLILLLNNDVEPLHPGWLDQLIAELDDPDIGAAGALLFFPDGFVQHAGITLGAGSVARHSFQFRRPGSGEDSGLVSQRQEVSAVTAACMLTRRALWKEVGGMDEHQLAVAFNDVDYCLKLRENGKHIIWTPHSRLMHRESVSRGRDDTAEKLARFAAEEGCMHDRWGARLRNDPFYNPNLSLVAGDRTLDIRPRDLTARDATLRPREFQS